MKELSYQDAINIISSGNQISLEDSFHISQTCSEYLLSEADEHFGRDIVIRILEAWDRVNQNTYPVWENLIESYGLYPYINKDKTVLGVDALLRLEYHKSKYLESIYFHSEQQELSFILNSGKSLVLSAPTSFGKSLLIEEIVASKTHKNIVVIQPTLALLDETRKKLSKYYQEYEILVSTTQEPAQDKRNLFLFTAERVVEYRSFPQIDFFVIDEFYKLSLQREDDRAITLNHAFRKLLRMTKKFYLLGPMIKGIPDEFKQKFELTWKATDFSTVAVNEINVEYDNSLKKSALTEERQRALFALLDTLNEPTLIYCSAPEKATNLALDYTKHRKIETRNIENKSNTNSSIIEWIKEGINPSWSLIQALEQGIGVHHGALPRHLSSAIVDAFNQGEIQLLFCTSTLIEGVNTSAKNVVLFDGKKGTKPIDFFDYKNIAGRTGRMSKYFVGRVYKFSKQPDQHELDVDIPILTQNEAPIEILIGLDESELKPEAKEKLKGFSALDKNLQEIIKLNSGMSFEGQLKIIREIEDNLNKYHPLLAWTQFPTYEQLGAVIQLAWENLRKPKENTGSVLSASQLNMLTMLYLSNKSVRMIINSDINGEYWTKRIPDINKRIDNRTFNILNVARHWFDYKLPKWLSTVSSLQEYAFTKNGKSHGNYLFVASQIEHGFLAPGLAALTEYDIPITAIRKMAQFLNADKKPTQLLIDLRNAEHLFNQVGLIEYEKNKIRRATKEI